MRDFRDLDVWHEAHKLALLIYDTATKFPEAERFALTNQIRRAALSVPTNIAEGCGRGGQAELARFMEIAMGSCSEVEYLLIFARDMAYITGTDHATADAQVVRVKKMLSTFISRIRRPSRRPADEPTSRPADHVD